MSYEYPMNLPRNVLAANFSHFHFIFKDPLANQLTPPIQLPPFNRTKNARKVQSNMLWSFFVVENLWQKLSKSPFSVWFWTLREFVGGNQIAKAIKGSLWPSFHSRSLCIRIIFEGVTWRLHLGLAENYADLLVTCNEQVSFSANMGHSKSSCHFKNR